MKKILYPFLIISLIIGFVACSDDLETAPTDRVAGPVIFETTKGAQVAMDGIYRMLYTSTWGDTGWTTGNHHQNFGIMSTKIYTSLMGEDFLQDAMGNGWFYFDYRFDVRSRYTASTWRPYATWNFYYTLISNANYILAEEENLEGDPAEIDNIMAQAYAIRAYAYFQLIQSFQQTYVGNQTAPGVPLYTEATTAASEGKGRGTVEEVYTQINLDLNDAIAKFESAGISQSHVSHIDLYVANAIKANVALVQNKWDVAANHAKVALGKGEMLGPNDIHDGFNNAKRKDVLWGAEIIADQSTIYASFFSHMDARADRYARSSRKCIYNWLYDQIPSNDARKKWWQDPNGPDVGKSNHNIAYNQHKFLYAEIDGDLGDYIFMRKAEMQLVYAEALCHDQKYTEAKAALEELLKRRRDDWATVLDGVTMSNELTMGSIGSAKTLMDHIILQRRIELWGEAERIFDLQRLKMGFDRGSKAGGSNHSDFLSAFDSKVPASKEFILTIPQKEFDGNPNMSPSDQNPM